MSAKDDKMLPTFPYAGQPTRAPNAMARVRAKRAEIDAQVTAGEITLEEGQRLYKEFASLTIAHVKEHGPKGA